ncbi:MAG TPA: hypothetical protein DCY07_07300 [Rhodospirillaceae bacterium]|nr:hypothetical protein [Rhodospirillaceae bacterium]
MPQVDFHQMSLKLAKFDRGHFQEQTDVSFSNLSIAHEGVSLIQMREGQTISVVMGSVLTGEGDVPVSLNVRGMATQEAPIYPRVNVLTNIVKMAKSCAGSLLNDSRQIMPSGTMKLASNLRKMITKNCG